MAGLMQTPDQPMPEAEKTLLIVEDNPADVSHYLRLLEEFNHGFDGIQVVGSLIEAHRAIKSQRLAACLLDNFLPDGSAIDLLEGLGELQLVSPCPIVVVTESDDLNTAVQLMKNGALDYLIKSQISAVQLQRTLLNSIRTWTLQSRINHLALHDPLTGLVNRTLFMDRLSQQFDYAKRYSHEFALIYLDLDHFKQINDQYGHEAGDEILKIVGHTLRATLRSTDTAARLGGDEFAVILPDTDNAKAHLVAHKLVKAISIKYNHNSIDIEVTPSIGLSTSMLEGTTKDYCDMMREADIALYKAKSDGRARYRAFNAQLDHDMRESDRLRSALPRAILNQELQLAWQPIYNTQTRQLEKVEALLRWKQGEDWIRAEAIVDLVIQGGLGNIFHQWLFTVALEQLSHWLTEHPTLQASINLPANLCHDPSLTDLLIACIQASPCTFEQVTVEVTETHLMQAPKQVQRQLEQLANHGIEIAIDDFGTGYSSLAYLASLPVNTLKIDKAFFLGLDKNPRNTKIIEATNAMVHRLGMRTIAEGIETQALFEQAKSLGCDYVQGFWLGAPVFAESTLEHFLVSSRKMGAPEMAHHQAVNGH
jgi:diguanylate cyclase (GGDEF)-like protein